MKRTLIAAASLLALAACNNERASEASQADRAARAEAGAVAAEDVAAEASAAADAASGAQSGSAAAPEPGGRAIGAPPPINGPSGAAPAEAGGSVRPELGQRPPEDPTTGTLARPDTPMPQTTPDGRPAL